MLKVIFLLPGHEIGVRSLAPDQTHTYWRNITYLDLVKDVIGLKLKLTLNGIHHVTGYRAPFHQSAGDTTFSALQEYGFEYDSSLPIRSKDKQWWPFTMDSGIHSFDCLSPPCPKCKWKIYASKLKISDRELSYTKQNTVWKKWT